MASNSTTNTASTGGDQSSSQSSLSKDLSQRYGVDVFKKNAPTGSYTSYHQSLTSPYQSNNRLDQPNFQRASGTLLSSQTNTSTISSGIGRYTKNLTVDTNTDSSTNHSSIQSYNDRYIPATTTSKSSQYLLNNFTNLSSGSLSTKNSTLSSSSALLNAKNSKGSDQLTGKVTNSSVFPENKKMAISTNPKPTLQTQGQNAQGSNGSTSQSYDFNTQNNLTRVLRSPSGSENMNKNLLGNGNSLSSVSSPKNALATKLRESNESGPQANTFQDLQLPNHEPTKCSVKTNGIVKAYAANTNQGLVRNYNEDRVSIILNIMKPASRVNENWPKCSFFGVYDGHGGVNCADFLRDNLHQFVRFCIWISLF